MLDYLSRHYDFLLTSLLEHIFLTFVSLFIALLIALPLGYWLSGHRRVSVPVLSVLGIIYAIPSLGMFALLIPLVGLGSKPAIIALVVYSQLILVRNVISGFQAIDPSIIEAAKGMGFSAWRQFVRIELPLALPVIIGGVRIASVSVIGIATIAAWINAGGLGGILFEGLYQNSIPKMVWGTLLVSSLALSTNIILLRVEKSTLRRARGEQRV
ncbi:osmoprotectant transport system permease protein [Paenibacillus castaneae]|uniref:ABC transporter permease n=1 Tax=Paenibacillus castaneae TaxID=474957 RepID=UPI000C99B641|nr:ABC transporter permease [Paenibacillus castaneae]NIK77056.1 osmoprotectant transport system permease protein [Paenibacillus castaneae]